MSAYTKTYSCDTTLIEESACVAVLSTDMSKVFYSFIPALMLQMLQAYSYFDKSMQLMLSFSNQRENCSY